MEYQHKLLLLAALLVAVALYALTTTGTPPEIVQNTSEAQSLLMTSVGFGKGLGDYTYSYSEVMNGYRTSYIITKAGDEAVVEIQNPLSTKKIYLLANDTILCIKYPIEESCSSIQQNAEMQNYVSFVRSTLFNDTNIAKAEGNTQYLITKGHVVFESAIEDKIVSGVACRQVTYDIDYSNATVDDAARYGIGTASPKKYHLTVCVNPETALAYDTTLTYQDKGMDNTRVTRVVLFKASAGAITPPAELSGDAVGVFRKEREKWVELATCYTDKQGDDRDSCAADMALKLRRKDICELAGARKDTCLLSVVPYTRDQTICTAISDSAYKDDCYGVLGDVLKDSSYCAYIQDATKKAKCMEVSAPSEVSDGATGGDEAVEGNQSSGETNQSEGAGTSDVDINKLLDYIDKMDTQDNQTGTNGTNTTNGTG